MQTSFPSLTDLRALLIALCALLLSAAGAHAQADDAAAPSDYWQAITQGVAQYRDGQFQRASESFALAQKLWPNARPLRGLGKVAFAQHHYVAAIDYFQRALESNVHPLEPDMKREVEELRAQAHNAVAQVSVELEPERTEITVDGQAARVPVGKPLELDPGDHVILARSPGYVSERRSYTLQSGERTSWSFRLQQDTVAAPNLSPREAARTVPLAAPDAHVDQHHGWLLPTGVTLAVAGLGMAGAGVAFSIAHFDDTDKVLSARMDTQQKYNERWSRSRSRMYLVSGVATGLLTLGAGALADYVPREQRWWLTPTLAAAGGALLATGLTIYAANRGRVLGGADVRARVEPSDRADTGSLMAMLSAPLLTIPLMHAVAWLSGDK